MLPHPSIVFVIGAGASKDFGGSMPIGRELAEKIRSSLHNDFNEGKGGPIFEALRNSPSGLTGEMHVAAQRICEQVFAQPSIDDLLNEWPDIPAMAPVGKVAIGSEILRAEHDSHLRNAAEGNRAASAVVMNDLSSSWLGRLARMLRPGVDRRDVAKVFGDVGFVVFNYDRCVEQFLFCAIRQMGALSDENAAIVLRTIPIIHPHGDLGPLHLPPFDDAQLRFGQDSGDLLKIADRIKTYSEEQQDAKSRATIVDMMRNARKIIFLGFGYHEKNMDVLLGERQYRGMAEIWGASADPGRRALEEAQARLSTTETKLVSLTASHCKDFLTESQYRIFAK
jgi:hypothetical protein